MKKNKQEQKKEQEQIIEAAQKNIEKFDDADLKRKKNKAVIVAISCFIIIAFVIVAFYAINQSRVKEVTYNVEGVKAADVTDSKDVKKKIDSKLRDDIILDTNQKTVTVTVPVELFEDGTKITSTLTSKQKQSGYVSATLNSTEVIYVIKSGYYPSVIEDIYNQTYKYLKSFENGKAYVATSLVSSNFAMNKATITFNKKSYNDEEYKSMLKSIYKKMAIYQCYCGITPKSLSVEFQLKYIHEQFAFNTVLYPNEMK